MMEQGRLKSADLEQELLSKVRDFKLKVLNDDIKFDVNRECIKKNRYYLNFISKKLQPDDIITGSLALSMFGLLDRHVGDIDVIIKDSNRYESYYEDDYDMKHENRLGIVWFKYRDSIFKRSKYVKVDFFINNKTNFIEVELNKNSKIRLHNPLEIISFKLNIIQSKPRYGNNRFTSEYKHYSDLNAIFN